MNNIRINEANKTIEVTKAFYKEASNFGTDEYKMLKEARTDFPTFKVIAKSAGKKNGTFKGLTINYMKTYIKDHEPDNMKDFNILCGLDENGEKVELAATATYGEIKSWFLKKYPVFNEYTERVNKLLKNA